jgi:hypothetical protein
MTLELVGVTVGTNEFLEGTALAKLLNRRIPPAGFQFAGMTLRRPFRYNAGNAPVTAWVRLRGDLTSQNFAYYWDGSKVFAKNKSGREIANPSARPHRTSSNEVLLGVELYAFPRDEEKVIVEIWPPVGAGVKAEVAKLEFTNPLPGRTEHWVAGKTPLTNFSGGEKFVLLGMQLNPTYAQFELPSQDWSIPEARITDEEGNSFSWSRSEKPFLDRVDMGFQWSLEPDRIWRVDAKCVATYQFPDSRRGFDPDETRIAMLTLNGPEVTITNQDHEVFYCAFKGNEIGIRKKVGFDRPYWIVVGATNEMSKAVTVEGGSSWMGWTYGPKEQKWAVRQSGTAGTNLVVQLACPKVLNVEFYVKPSG